MGDWIKVKNPKGPYKELLEEFNDVSDAWITHLNRIGVVEGKLTECLRDYVSAINELNAGDLNALSDVQNALMRFGILIPQHGEGVGQIGDDVQKFMILFKKLLEKIPAK